MRLQLAEHTRALTLAIAENAGNRDLGVVIEDRLRHAVEERERSHVPVAERFRRLCWVAHHEDRVEVRQVHREEVDLALDAADHADRFAEVGLGMPWRMHKRHEHLLRPPAPAGNVVLHDRDLARKPVLVAEPLEDPLGCMPLLLRPILVGRQNRINNAGELVELRPERRLLANVSRRYRELQHLRDRSGVDAEPIRRSTLADPLDQNGVPDPRVKLHCLHPPPPQAKDSKCRSLTPAQPNKSAASVRDYCSGFYSGSENYANRPFYRACA